MVTSAVASYGTLISWNGANLAEISSISGPGVKIDTIDVTSYASPDAFKEFIAGFGDGGEVTIEGNFLPSDTPGQVAFITDAFAKTTRAVVITGPTAAAFNWSFNALVTNLEFKQPLEEQLGFTATLKISGKPTLGITISDDLTSLTGVEENAGAALTFNPTFAGATYTYNVTVNTASTWVKFTPTHAGATIKIYIEGVYNQSVASGAQSGTVALGAAGSITRITLENIESGKVGKKYYVNIYRA